MGQLQDDLNRNLPSSKVDILAINENGQDSANAVAAAINDLPLLQDTGTDDVWGQWSAEWRDVQVVDAKGEMTDVLNLSSNDLRIQSNYNNLRSMIVDAATSDRVAQSPWQNRIEPLDINNDGNVVPNDALRIINRLNGDGPGELPVPSGEPTDYLDVSGDNFVTSLDALQVIFKLNELSFAGAGEPEAAAEPPADDATVESSGVDALFALDFANEDDENNPFADDDA